MIQMTRGRDTSSRRLPTIGVTVATAALGSPYVLSDEGVFQLAEMVERGSAPVSSPGFTSRLRESSDAESRLSRIEASLSASSSR